MSYICVVGGANIDLIGRPFSQLKLSDSNPGTLSVSLGGVGRNIAENMSRLKLSVKMITVLGDDVYCRLISENAKSIGLDLSESLKLENTNSSTYMALLDENGDMFVALSDMKILDNLTPEFLATKIDVLNNALCVVCDTNIPNCLEFLQKNVTAPLFLDTVSAKKTEVVKDSISNLFCIKPNVLEAEVLCGHKIKTQKDIDLAIAKIHSMGVKWVVLTDGKNGVHFSDGTTKGHLPSLATNVVNATGAGDSFVAGLVFGFVDGKDISYAVKCGSILSAKTIASQSTVSADISPEVLKTFLKQKGEV